MSVIDTLITDRKQADVDHAKALADRISAGINTSEEYSEFILTGLKGCYGILDMNRVGNAEVYLADRINASGTSVSISPKTNWTISDYPTPQQRQDYLTILTTLRSIFSVVPMPVIPADLIGLTYQEANNIEKILLAIDETISRIAQSFVFSNEIYCGEDCYAAGSPAITQRSVLGTAKLGELILGG